MNESRHTYMSRAINEGALSLTNDPSLLDDQPRINESCHMRTGSITHEIFHIWISCFGQGRVVWCMNESCPYE